MILGLTPFQWLGIVTCFATLAAVVALVSFAGYLIVRK